MDVRSEFGNENMLCPSKKEALKLIVPKLHMLFLCPTEEEQILNESDYLRRLRANFKRFHCFYC